MDQEATLIVKCGAVRQQKLNRNKLDAEISELTLNPAKGREPSTVLKFQRLNCSSNWHTTYCRLLYSVPNGGPSDQADNDVKSRCIHQKKSPQSRRRILTVARLFCIQITSNFVVNQCPDYALLVLHNGVEGLPKIIVKLAYP
jgi:hypothetical protein